MGNRSGGSGRSGALPGGLRMPPRRDDRVRRSAGAGEVVPAQKGGPGAAPRGTGGSGGAIAMRSRYPAGSTNLDVRRSFVRRWWGRGSPAGAGQPVLDLAIDLFFGQVGSARSAGGSEFEGPSPGFGEDPGRGQAQLHRRQVVEDDRPPAARRPPRHPERFSAPHENRYPVAARDPDSPEHLIYYRQPARGGRTSLAARAPTDTLSPSSIPSSRTEQARTRG